MAPTEIGLAFLIRCTAMLSQWTEQVDDDR